MRLLLIASLLAAGMGIASANGRAPGSSTINFKRNDEAHIAAGMTWGVVYSTDSGATWTWECEEAVGYGGMYDPDYGFTSTGALFATTFDGIKVNRDACSYTRTILTPTAPAVGAATCDINNAATCPSGFSCAKDGVCEKVKFFSAIAISKGDGAVFAAAADPTDNQIYRSTDDGATFPVHPAPQGAMINDWYQSIEVSPVNSQVIYVTGYRLQAGQSKAFLLYKSVDGGASYQQLTGSGSTASSGNVNGMAVMPNSTIEIAALGKKTIGSVTGENIIYARVTLSDNSISDAIYRSLDGGGSWQKILEKQGSIAFVARSNGDIVAGTQALGSFKATETGLVGTLPTFTELAGAPHVNCLAENSIGEVWACTQNYGSPQVPTDMFGIMKSTDLTTWTGVFKYQDLKEPQSCAAGTTQKDRCDTDLWCGLCAQLGCNANRNCAITDGPPGNDGTPPSKPKSCCQAGNDDIPGLLLIGLAVGLVALRRKR